MSDQGANLPPPNGHYSHAAVFGDLMFVSGQLPIENGVVPSTFSDEVKCVLGKLEKILEANECSKKDVIQMRIYIVGVEKWDEVNSIYASFFKDHRPARVVVPVPELHFGCGIEIEAVAKKGSKEITLL